MRILIDICHPAHVHFFLHPMRILESRGHRVLITSRDKEMTCALLDRLGIEHEVLSTASRGGLAGLGAELIRRNMALYRLTRRYQPDVMAAIGGIFIAQVGCLNRVPSVVFYDTENAKLQNVLTYHFASQVVVPRCYASWVPKRHRRYAGYHELSYLHPSVFTPQRAIAIANGVASEGDTFFLRLVAWQANHDLGETGWSEDLLRQLVDWLEARGNVLISAEGELPADLDSRRYSGRPEDVHHVLAYSRLFVGESATMASECAVLGTPAVYVAQTGRGYTTEQEQRYGLVKNIHSLSWPILEQTLSEMLARSSRHWQEAQGRLLEDTIEVAPFVADCIENLGHTPDRED